MCKRSAETSRRNFLPGSCDSILTENSFVLGRGAKAKSLCKCALAALFRIIWEERNAPIFKEKSVDNTEELCNKVRLFALL